MLCPRCGDKVNATPDGWLVAVCPPCQLVFERDCKAALERHQKIAFVGFTVISSTIILTIYLAQPMPILTTFFALILMSSWRRQERKKILESHFKASK